MRSVCAIASFSLLAATLLQLAAAQNGAFPAYMEKIHQLRDLVNQKPYLPKPSAKQKPKKYKCVLVEDDDSNDQVALGRSFVSEYRSQRSKGLDADAVFRETTEPSLEKASTPQQLVHKESEPRSSAPAPPASPPRLKQVSLPRAHSIPLWRRMTTTSTSAVIPTYHTERYEETTRRFEEATTAATSVAPEETPRIPPNVPRDSENRPLILSPEHCKTIQHYANMYNVKDVKSWVHSNCAFAKMYLPTATCAEIDILVASCYANYKSR